MPVCPECGSQYVEGAAYCDNCGLALGGLAAAAPPTPAPQQAPAAAAATSCPSCGAPAIAGEAFCGSCGASLGVAVAGPAPVPTEPSMTPGVALGCPSCGAPLEPGNNFCDMCGTPLGAAAGSTPPGPPMPSQQVPTPGVAPGPPPVYAPMAAVQGRLVVQGTNASLPFPPGRTEIVVGREDPVSNVFPEIDLTDHGGDEGGVGRRHARIFLQGVQVLIEDLNSVNYTYVNRERLMPGQPRSLSDGDEVQLGRVKLTFYSA